jgi:hypothetical protein
VSGEQTANLGARVFNQTPKQQITLKSSTSGDLDPAAIAEQSLTEEYSKFIERLRQSDLATGKEPTLYPSSLKIVSIGDSSSSGIDLSSLNNLGSKDSLSIPDLKTLKQLIEILEKNKNPYIAFTIGGLSSEQDFQAALGRFHENGRNSPLTYASIARELLRGVTKNNNGKVSNSLETILNATSQLLYINSSNDQNTLSRTNLEQLKTKSFDLTWGQFYVLGSFMSVQDLTALTQQISPGSKKALSYNEIENLINIASQPPIDKNASVADLLRDIRTKAISSGGQSQDFSPSQLAQIQNILFKRSDGSSLQIDSLKALSQNSGVQLGIGDKLSRQDMLALCQRYKIAPPKDKTTITAELAYKISTDPQLSAARNDEPFGMIGQKTANSLYKLVLDQQLSQIAQRKLIITEQDLTQKNGRHFDAKVLNFAAENAFRLIEEAEKKRVFSSAAGDSSLSSRERRYLNSEQKLISQLQKMRDKGMFSEESLASNRRYKALNYLFKVAESLAAIDSAGNVTFASGKTRFAPTGQFGVLAFQTLVQAADNQDYRNFFNAKIQNRTRKSIAISHLPNLANLISGREV